MKKIYDTLSVLVLFAALGAAIVSCSDSDSVSFSNSEGSGQGGSMARFTIVDDYLYTVDYSTMRTVRLTDAAHPEYLEAKDQNLGFDIETIFPYNDKLFIGSRSALYIYDISLPEFPKFLSQTNHFTSCDPVVASGDYAYVTLNSESWSCSRGSNELQVYDISDLKKPKLIKRDMQMVSPKGLGVDASFDRLFVCDRGLKVYDISDPADPVWIDDLTNIQEARGIVSYDVIPRNGNLILIGADGLYQFDYTGPQIAFVSKIDLRK